MDTDLVLTGSELAIMPVMDIEAALRRRELILNFIRRIMKEGVDYGVIPGTGDDRKALLKSGAEKLTMLFGLTKKFGMLEQVEDWDGGQHNGEPFFYYVYRCSLYRGELLIAEADGSCNSHESKYRYRKAERLCPSCGKPAIIKGKAQYGGGWLCYAAKGGCGAKFQTGDKSIEGQEVGRVLNPDVADLANTILKMAQKRALVAATFLATNASEFFSTKELPGLDEDDRPEEPEGQPEPQAAGPKQQSAKPANGGNGHKPKAEPNPVDLFFERVQQATGNHYTDKTALYKVLGKWPNFKDKDDVDAALSIAVDHAGPGQAEQVEPEENKAA